MFWAGLVAALVLSGCTASPPPVASVPSPAAQAVPPPQSGTSATDGTGVVPPDLAQSVFFEPGTAALRPDARRQLDSWAETLRRVPGQEVTIVGHGDERSTRDYAIALGARRAAAVKAYLVALGVRPERLATMSVGMERPATAGFSEEAQQLDRRAVLVFESLAAVPQ